MSHPYQSIINVLTETGFQVDPNLFPDRYHQLYVEKKFDDEAPQWSNALANLTGEMSEHRDLAKVLGSILYFCWIQPQIWAEAIVQPATAPFPKLFTEIARPLHEVGLAEAYLKRGSLNEQYKTFEYEDLEFNLQQAANILRRVPHEATLADFDPYYMHMQGQIEIDPQWALREETDLTSPLWVATLPKSVCHALVIDGNHRLFKAAKQGSPYGGMILPCITFTLEETESILMSEHFRPVFLLALGKIK